MWMILYQEYFAAKMHNITIRPGPPYIAAVIYVQLIRWFSAVTNGYRARFQFPFGKPFGREHPCSDVTYSLVPDVSFYACLVFAT